MINIMCFGDSNTFGRSPSGPRHEYQNRWPGALQQLLGDDYSVFEEGLSGRTTVFEDPFEPCRCGLTALPYCLYTHKPLDLVIISLGANDTKAFFNASATMISVGMERLIKEIRRFPYALDGKAPRIMLLAPIKTGEQVNKFFPSFNAESRQKVEDLPALYKKVADKLDCLYCDCSLVAVPGADNLHMDAASHHAIAKEVAEIIRKIDFN